MSFVSKLTYSTHSIYLLVAPAGNKHRLAWFFVQIDNGKEKKFLHDATKGGIDIEKYGKVVCRGWGEYPPASVLEVMKSQYGFQS